MFYKEANWENPNYKEDQSHLFKKMYFGFLTGIEFTNNTLISPSLELRFIQRYGEYKGAVLNPFEIAINLVLRSKMIKSKEKTDISLQ